MEASRLIDMTGQTLRGCVVVTRNGNNRGALWLVRCACGVEHTEYGTRMRVHDALWFCVECRDREYPSRRRYTRDDNTPAGDSPQWAQWSAELKKNPSIAKRWTAGKVANVLAWRANQASERAAMTLEDWATARKDVV